MTVSQHLEWDLNTETKCWEAESGSCRASLRFTDAKTWHVTIQQGIRVIDSEYRVAFSESVERALRWAETLVLLARADYGEVELQIVEGSGSPPANRASS